MRLEMPLLINPPPPPSPKSLFRSLKLLKRGSFTAFHTVLVVLLVLRRMWNGSLPPPSRSSHATGVGLKLHDCTPRS